MTRDTNPHEPYKLGDEVCSIALPHCYGTIDRVILKGYRGPSYHVKADPGMNHFTDGFSITHDECRLQVEVEAEDADWNLRYAQDNYKRAQDAVASAQEYRTETYQHLQKCRRESTAAKLALTEYTTPDRVEVT